MFWRMNAGLSASSSLEATLDRALGGGDACSAHSGGSPTSANTVAGAGSIVDQLLDEPDLLSELKAGNARICQVLSNKENVRNLLAWAVYGTDEIERHAAKCEARVLEKLRAEHRDQSSNISGSTTSDTANGHDQTDDSTEMLQNHQDDYMLSAASPPQPDQEGEARRQRFPHLATEIICGDYFQISETIWSHLTELLGPTWDIILSSREQAIGMPAAQGYNSPAEKETFRALLRHEIAKSTSDRDEEDNKKREIIRGNWTRINGMLMQKHPAQMFQFVKSVPHVVERLVERIDSSAVQDTLLRIVACEEAGVSGVVEWLCDQSLVPLLLGLLSPCESPSTHSTVAEVIKAIISLTSPNAFNPGPTNVDSAKQESTANDDGGVQASMPSSDPSSTPPNGHTEESTTIGQRNNRLIRELVMPATIKTLIQPVQRYYHARQEETKNSDSSTPTTYTFDPYDFPLLPSMSSITSAFCQSLTILIELIRKNNSDYSEPYLFHSIRNRLMSMQQRKVESRHEARRQADQQQEYQDTSVEEDTQDRIDMEAVMEEMSHKLGIVHLGPLLCQVSEQINALQDMVQHPQERVQIPGTSHPLTVARFRIVELYAEMLHCSNMLIHNRPAGSGPRYTEDGKLQGGLEALEELGTALGGTTAEEDDADDEAMNQVTPARDLPVSSSAGSTAPSHDGSEKGGSDTEADVDPNVASLTISSDEPILNLSIDEPMEKRNQDEEPRTPTQSTYQEMSSNSPQIQQPPKLNRYSTLRASNTAAHRPVVVSDDLPVDDKGLATGDLLKNMYIEHGVLVVVINLFFEHVDNNFLHNVTYDIVQQILNGRLDQGRNRQLVCELFNAAKLIERILDTQRLNAVVSNGRRAKRLGLMGHMLLIADEIQKFMERCPRDLYATISDSFVQSEWDAFVTGELRESRDRDAQPLGGGRPPLTLHTSSSRAKSDSSDDEEEITGALAGQPLTRSMSSTSNDGFGSGFGFGSGEGDETRFRGFNRMLTNETYSGAFASSDEDSDDSSSESPKASRFGGRQHFLSDGFENAFSPSSGSDDDGWGDFTSGADPFGDSFESSQHKPGHMSIHTNRPMTAADFANQAFEEQFAGEATTSVTNEDGNILIPDNMIGEDSFESNAQFIASNWSVPGGDVDKGEDLPASKPARGSISSSSSSSSSVSSPSSSPERNKSLHPAARIGRRRSSRSSAISPPEASLVKATDDSEPYGHGVSPETTVREDGMLERNVNGHTVWAPQDDISLAATHHRRNSMEQEKRPSNLGKEGAT